MSTPDQTPALPHELPFETVTRLPAPPRPAGNETEDFIPAAIPAKSPTLPPDSVEIRQICTDGIRIPGYEILATLGRGGMGVVYQARQTKLGRIVALKMILAGAHAGEAELARFRTEAEAIARLTHPNIVQIYEIGEHGGLPYIALEFCGGGSLEKKLSGTPLPAQEAAALVASLARAMAAAHHKGVIHRDLKPANVLLAEDGTPKITDFGLAKKLDEAGQTASGAIMGTPSYMAPEQAGGQSQLIGPLCDTYALGAILYECLTGRPPFKAATALDTMMQVVSDEPVPPSRLQTKTPRDLETICLKCLHKEAGKRYATAADLADDVRRFLNSEPIRARPVGRMERAAKWVRRNPLVAALAALVVLTNTFQAHTAQLARFGLEDRLEEINGNAVRIARQAAERSRFVLGDIGPFFFAEGRTVSADRKDLAQVLTSLEGVDGILFETYSHPSILPMMAYAFHRLIEVETPLLLSLTYQRTPSDQLLTISGHAPETFAHHAERHGIAALGVNCGCDIDMDDIIEILRRYRAETDLPLFARPNAGTPTKQSNRWIYPHTPETMAVRLPELLEAGASMIGGCCGTTPEHIAAFRTVIDARKEGRC